VPAFYPCLWFDGRAEEAAEFYAGLLPDSHVDRVWRSPAATPSGPAGMVLTVDFTLLGTRVQGLNGGPDFRFSEAVSFVVECDDQAEVDRLWDALTADGGEPGPCGWLKDRFGVSWQVIPAGWEEVYTSDDPGRAERAMQAMMGMKKLDLAALQAAADGA
jgi:predicted 3-demethylubiquinone-9 3-methyltransferase (glyoxalase superfamily)